MELSNGKGDVVSDQSFGRWVYFRSGGTIAQISAFHWNALVIATIIHLVVSSLVGLLYGAALPMFSRGRPILLGGVDRPYPLDGSDP